VKKATVAFGEAVVFFKDSLAELHGTAGFDARFMGMSMGMLVSMAVVCMIVIVVMIMVVVVVVLVMMMMMFLMLIVMSTNADRALSRQSASAIFTH
jgi:hypothetical protein